jgi:hypothetical protein
MLRTVDLKVQVKTVFKDRAGFSQAFSAPKRKSTAEIRCNSIQGLARFTREPRTSGLPAHCRCYGRGGRVGGGRGVGVERGAGVDVAVGVAVAGAVAVAVAAAVAVAVAVAVGVGEGPQPVGM